MFRRLVLVLLCVGCVGVCFGEEVPKSFRGESADGEVIFDRKTDRWLLDGKPYTGRVTQRHENGEKWQVIDVAEGVPHGAWLSFHLDGKISGMHTLSKGKFVGASCSWNTQGEITYVASYVDGKLHGVHAQLHGLSKGQKDRVRTWAIDVQDRGKTIERFRSANTVLER